MINSISIVQLTVLTSRLRVWLSRSNLVMSLYGGLIINDSPHVMYFSCALPACLQLQRTLLNLL